MFALNFARRAGLIASVLTVLFGLAACSTTVATAPATAAAPTDAPPKALLWAGNSFFYYNNSMHGHVGAMLGATGVKGVRQTSVTISGAGINWHDLASYFKPGGMASYSFVANNEVVFNTFDRPYDAVMMMDCSQCPIHPQLKPIFFDTARKHAATARANGAQPMLFMSWAYQDKPEMTDQLAAEYIVAGRENKALVVPAGLAFAKSIAKRPDINLYASDKRHPSLAGTYLGAAVVLATVFKMSPVGISYTAGLAPDVAQHLQNTAWETVQNFKP
ncbi:MAG TPA: hypothetical protein PLL01_11365 [Rhodoferax sp.]|mgnify:CR=1 FL=1|nr:hypothetical protein [Rhodoferax sp.]HPW29977.1 hypothetical protein [Rhodoferax sp.]